MRSFAVFCALGSLVSAQFYDGYNNVTHKKTPKQVRLAYYGDSGMTVSWNTFTQEKNPKVKYGLKKNKIDQVATSHVSITYNSSLTYNNHVTITGLEPNTQYWYYPVGPKEGLTVTEPYSFTTGRSAGDKTPYTMAVIVDMGTFGPLGLSTGGGPYSDPLAQGEQTTISAMAEMLDTYEFIAHPGDIGYADSWLKEEVAGYLPKTSTFNGSKVYESIANAFFDELEPLSSFKPYMVSPGNHEANCDNGGTGGYNESICVIGQTNFTGYINHWRMPSNMSGGVSNFWYSYDHGLTHFIHIDTETDLGHGLIGPDEGSPEFTGPFGVMNQQVDWLASDLAAVNRTATPWVIVMGHRPLYGSTAGVCANCITAFEPLFKQYDVDMYFAGHAHYYERMDPLYNGTADPKGLNNPNSTWYIINGIAGHYMGMEAYTDTQPYSVYQQHTQYSWSTLTFHNCTHMTLNALYSANNTVYDEATLYKNRTC